MLIILLFFAEKKASQAKLLLTTHPEAGLPYKIMPQLASPLPPFLPLSPPLGLSGQAARGYIFLVSSLLAEVKFRGAASAFRSLGLLKHLAWCNHSRVRETRSVRSLYVSFSHLQHTVFPIPFVPFYPSIASACAHWSSTQVTARFL